MLPPVASEFPAYPSGWYLFGSARELKRSPASKSMLDRRLVAFRQQSGGVAVLDAACSHQGADLGRGDVVGDCLRCPYHHWQYDAGGQCRRIPAQAAIPEFAQQRNYPAVERHGLIFFYNGREPLYPLPFFFDCRPEDFVAGRPLHLDAQCAWYMLAGNAFDRQHYGTVHGRRLVAPPAIDCPAPFARRVQFRAEVVGDSIYDRLLRPLAGRFVDISITNWGGGFFAVTAFFRRAQSYILFAPQPVAEHRTRLDVMVYARRKALAVSRACLEPLELEVRRLFTYGFIAREIEQLTGIRYCPQNLLPSDQMLIDYYVWMAGLFAKPPAREKSDELQDTDACRHV